MVNFTEWVHLCVLKDIDHVKLRLDKTVLLGKAYIHHNIPVLSNSVENFYRTNHRKSAIFKP